MATEGRPRAVVVLAAAAALACSVAAPAGAGAPAPLPPELSLGNASGPVVTSAQASAIVTRLWPLREDALARDDIALTDRLETGVAREFDDAVSADDRARPQHPGLRRARDHRAIRVFVPVQRGYPAAFLAEVDTSLYGADPSAPAATTRYTEMMVLTRRDRSSTWKVSLDTGYGLAVPESPVEVAGGFDAPPLASWVAPIALPGMLAGYWQTWKDTGAAPADAALWVPGYWTSQHGPFLAQHRNGVPQPSCGCIAQTRYTASPAADGLWTFTVHELSDDAPRNLTCSTVRIHDRLVPDREGAVLSQDARRDNWGGLLAPGRYSSITQDSVRQTCILSGTTQADGLGAVGGNGDLVRVQGAAARPSGLLADIGQRFRITPLAGGLLTGTLLLTALGALAIGVAIQPRRA